MVSASSPDEHSPASPRLPSGPVGALSRLATWVLVAAPAVVIACHTLQNNDLPMHLAVGDWILDHHEVPDRDPFSGNGLDQPWVPHEWLAAVLFAVVERASGATGLITFTMLLSGVLAIVHASVMQRLGVGTHAQLWLSIPVWVIAGQRLMLRPHMFSLVLALGVWWVLLAARTRPRVLLFLPGLLAFWANVHGSFYLGLGIVALDLWLGKEHTITRAQRWGLLLACASALLFTPHPIAGVVFPFSLTSDPVFMREIAEWSPPLGSSLGSALFRETPAFAFSVAWLVLVIFGARRGLRRLPLSYCLACAAALLLYARHQRYAALFVLATVPLAHEVIRSYAGRRPWLARIAVFGTACFFAYPGYPATWTGFRSFPTGTGIELWGPNLPIFESELLAKSGYRGTVVCEYEYGGVIAWKSRGALRPTMDSRNSVYGADRFIRHQAGLTSGDPVLLSEAVAAVVRSPWADARRLPLHERLEDDPDWLLISFTSQTFLYVRAGAGSLDRRAYYYVSPATGRIRRPMADQLNRLQSELDSAADLGWRPNDAQWGILESWGIEKPR